jgi:signal transduction histidine kinase
VKPETSHLRLHWRERLAAAVRPSQATVLIAAVLIAVVAVGGASEIVQRRRFELEGARRETANLAYALSEETARSLETVDLVIKSTAEAAAARGIVDPHDYAAAMTTESVYNGLTQRLSGVMQLDAITMIAADGTLLNFTRSWPAARVNVSDRDYFVALMADSKLERFISLPVQNRGTGTWTIYLARRVTGPKGEFLGLVLGAIQLLHFERLYAGMVLGSSGTILLARTEGTLLVRYPGLPNAVGSVFASPVLLALTDGNTVTIETQSPLDHRQRIVSARRLPNLPLLIAVTRARDEVLAQWYSFSIDLTAIIAVIAAFIGAVFYLLGRQIARREFSERTLEATFENMSQGIMMIDAQSRVQVCNQRAMTLLDLPRSLMASRPLFSEILRHQLESGEFGESAGDLDEVLRAFVLSGGLSAEPHEYIRHRANGVTLEIRSTPLEQGGVVRTYTDITEAKTTESELRAAHSAADGASRIKDEFLATMSHEIRSPMSGLLGIIELLRGTRLDADQARMLKLVDSSASSLLAVLNDILDFSKIEAGALAIVPEVTGLEDLIAETVHPHRVTARHKGLRLLVEIDQDVPRWVRTDPLRLRQILNNLLSNAVKFTRCGEVVVHLRQSGDGPDARLECVVRDQGIGMSAEIIARLFQPFMQAEASTTRNFGGTGLGLSISRRLAVLLAGDLQVASTPGEGSVFTLRLPLIEVAAPASSDPAGGAIAMRAGALAGWRVLVAEDDPTNRWLAHRQLALLGVAVVVANDGKAAFAALQDGGFDGLITDCHMPQMDGAELTRAVRGSVDPVLRRLPVIGLTADITGALRERCQVAGMSEVVLKPLTLERMYQLLVKHLAGAGEPAAVLAAGPVSTAFPVFDPATYRELFAADDEIGDGWLAEYAGIAGDLGAELMALLAGSPESAASRAVIEATAHRLAGSSLSVGALSLGEAARSLDGAAATADPSELRRLGDAVQVQLVLAREAIAAFRHTIAA